MEETRQPRLYLIMRRDLWDMNPGKAIAQGSHATDDFKAWRAHIRKQPNQYGELIAEFDAWKEDRNFGTVLVLHETLDTMNEIMNKVSFGGLTTDPTYPYRNWYGEVFTRKEITCGWVFMCNQSGEEEWEYMKNFSLHR